MSNESIIMNCQENNNIIMTKVIEVSVVATNYIERIKKKEFGATYSAIDYR